VILTNDSREQKHRQNIKDRRLSMTITIINRILISQHDLLGFECIYSLSLSVTFILNVLSL
jgi:hypothetical protein